MNADGIFCSFDGHHSVKDGRKESIFGEIAKEIIALELVNQRTGTSGQNQMNLVLHL